MKNLLKLPVLLLSLMLVASCGDSKKEEEEKKLSPVEQAAAEAKKLAELECDLEIAYLEDDFDKLDKLEEQLKTMKEEIEKKWGDEKDDKIRDAGMKAYDNVRENCQEKIAEAEEKARQETISEVTAVAEKIAELECDLEIAYLEDDFDKLDKLEEQLKTMKEEIEKKWGDEKDDKIRDAGMKAYDNVRENCQEKIAEAEEKARQETISEVTAVAEKIAELRCDLQIAYLEDDYDEVDKLEEQITKMEEEIVQEWADILAADSEVEKAATAAYEKVLENCNS